MTSPLGCPSCGAALTGMPTCTACGLPLSGALAGRLWQVDQQLAGLEQQRSRLTVEREDLLTRLRSGEVAPPVLMQPPAVVPAPVRHEANPAQVQNTLLTLGALLLAVAGIVFTAVVYRKIGVVGRATILLALTGAAAWVPTKLIPRGLTASAESIAGVAVVLAILDAYALRTAGIGDGLEATTYWAVATATLAAVLGGYGAVVPVRLARWSAVVLAQLPLPLLLVRLDATSSVAAVALVGQATTNLAAADRAPLPVDVRRLAGAFGGLFALVALVSGADAIEAGERAAWAGFAALAGLAAVASWQARTQMLQHVLALAVAPLLAVAAWAGARPQLTSDQEPLVLVAVALLALQVIGLLPRDRREGATYGALGVTAVSLLLELEPVLQAIFGPMTWLADPWTGTESTARLALGPDLSWNGTVVTLVVLTGAALATGIAGTILHRVRQSLVPAAVLLVLSAVTLPLGFATSYHDALLLLLIVAGILTVTGVVVLERVRLIGIAILGSGIATGLLACVWSSADQDSTITVLALVAALCAGAAVLLPGVLTLLALLLGGAELAAVGASHDLAADQVGGLLLAAVVVCVALSWLLRGDHRVAAEGAAALLAITAVSCSTEDPGWLSWTLAGAGLAALVISIRPDRRVVGLVGGLLLAASSWVRLADAEVHAPEPYVVPLAVASLVAGYLRRRSHPTAGSWEVYAGGLVLGLLPSLLWSLGDESPTRGLLLLGVSVAVVLVGGLAKLQAPLLLGAIVAVIDALVLLAPYANALPRWLVLATLGLMLVALGATYEQRRKDLERVREKYAALG